MKRIVAATLVLAMTGVAAGDGKKLLVLQSEGRADAKTRAAVDAAIVKLAKSGGNTVTTGELNYSDAAALVGCTPTETACRDEVIASLAVDEIVITTVTPKPGGFDVAVRRASKGTAKDATATVTADKVELAAAIGPLFGAKPVGPPPPVTDPTKTNPIGPTKPDPTIGPTTPVTDPPKIDPVDPTKTDPTVTPLVTDPAKTESAVTAKPLDQPAGDDRREKRRHRLRMGGMIGGGSMLLLGFILWGAANGTDGDIANFQVRSRADLERLQDLERKGAAYAGWGNLMVLGGLGLGGVSTYYYFKARKKNRNTPTTAVSPMLFDRGAGVSLTIGGLR